MKHLKSYKLFELHSDTYKDTYRKMKVTSVDRADKFKLSYRETSYYNLCTFDFALPEHNINIQKKQG